jgi:hypothetical protein
MTTKAKQDKTDDTVDTPDPEPPSLVGSGAPMVTLRANAGCLGLSAGEVATFAESEETKALVANGIASLVSG